MANREITKNALAVAFKTLMEHESYESVTIGNIADEAGISRNTFYYHFKDKAELVNWIFQKAVDSLGKQDSHTYERLKAEGEYIFRNKDYYQKILLSSTSQNFISYVTDYEQKVIRERILFLGGDLEFTEKELQRLSRFYANGMIGNLMDWARKGMENDPEPYIRMISDIISGEITKRLQMARMQEENR